MAKSELPSTIQSLDGPSTHEPLLSCFATCRRSRQNREVRIPGAYPKLSSLTYIEQPPADRGYDCLVSSSHRVVAGFKNIQRDLPPHNASYSSDGCPVASAASHDESLRNILLQLILGLRPID